jgi:hypothetical protein
MTSVGFHHLRVVISAIVLATLPLQSFAQENNEVLKQRFLQEAPGRWEEYKRLSEEMQGTVSFSHNSNSTSGNRQHRVKSERKINSTSQLARFYIKDIENGKIDREVDEVYARNSKYAFILERETTEAPWVLTQYSDLKDDWVMGRIAFRHGVIADNITTGVRLQHDLFFDIVHKPEFQIKSCRYVEIKGGKYVEVVFIYDKMDGKTKTRLEGSLVFDPGRFWSLRSGDISVTGDFGSGREKFTLIQSENDGEFPPLSRVMEFEKAYETTSADFSIQSTYRSEVNLRRPRNLPDDSEFTLGAFELPEPHGMTWEKPTPRYVWFLAAAGVCVGLALTFRYLSRRHRISAQA